MDLSVCEDIVEHIMSCLGNGLSEMMVHDCEARVVCVCVRLSVIFTSQSLKQESVFLMLGLIILQLNNSQLASIV